VQKFAKSLSENDQAALVAAYQEIGVPAEQLVATPHAVDQIADQFSARTDRSVAPPLLARELLRLQKQGKLPRLTRKTAS
jgi:hypothetical protein